MFSKLGFFCLIFALICQVAGATVFNELAAANFQAVSDMIANGEITGAEKDRSGLNLLSFLLSFPDKSSDRSKIAGLLLSLRPQLALETSFNPLFAAIAMYHRDAVFLLLRYGANVSGKDSFYGKSAIEYAENPSFGSSDAYILNILRCARYISKLGPPLKTDLSGNHLVVVEAVLTDLDEYHAKKAVLDAKTEIDLGKKAELDAQLGDEKQNRENLHAFEPSLGGSRDLMINKMIGHLNIRLAAQKAAEDQWEAQKSLNMAQESLRGSYYQSCGTSACARR